MKQKLLVLFVYSAIVLFPATAMCQEEKDWDFELAPFYLWAINIDGDMGIRGRTASVQVDFSDVWDNLQAAYTVRLNVMYRNKFGVLLDYNHLDLGKEKLNNFINIDVDFKSQILNLAATYRLLDDQHKLDGIAGIRYTALDAGVDFNNIGVSLSGDEDWVDPIIGLRYGCQVTDKWSLILYGDIGGFGTASDFTWQGAALIDFQPWKNVAIVAGYRAIGTDYTSGSGSDEFTYDAVVHGPIFGLDIRW